MTVTDVQATPIIGRLQQLHVRPICQTFPTACWAIGHTQTQQLAGEADKLLPAVATYTPKHKHRIVGVALQSG